LPIYVLTVRCQEAYWRCVNWPNGSRALNCPCAGAISFCAPSPLPHRALACLCERDFGPAEPGLCDNRPQPVSFLHLREALATNARFRPGTPRPVLSRQSFFEVALSLASRSAFSRSRFLCSAICSFSYSVSGRSDGRNALLASLSRLLMT
jgi:hypothetical protein